MSLNFFLVFSSWGLGHGWEKKCFLLYVLPVIHRLPSTTAMFVENSFLGLPCSVLNARQLHVMSGLLTTGYICVACSQLAPRHLDRLSDPKRFTPITLEDTRANMEKYEPQ